MKRSKRRYAGFRLFKATYTDPKTGKQRETPAYHVEFRDHLERPKRLRPSPARRHPPSWAGTS